MTYRIAAWSLAAAHARIRGISKSASPLERRRVASERRFADADSIRAELAAEGIILEDKPDGTTDWRRA